jgi:cytochrome c oxidase cbb3-type subunit 3
MQKGCCGVVTMNVAALCRLLLLAASFAAFPAHAHTDDDEPALDSSSQSTSSEGARIFGSTCSSCHGLDGHGGQRAPDIAGRRDIQKLTDTALSRIIRQGVPGTGMPSFPGLGTLKVQAIVRHLRWLQGGAANTSLPGSPKTGQILFAGKAGCSECHMVNGKGGFIGSDLSNYAHARSAEQIRQVVTDPDKNLSDRGKMVTATTADGHTFTGIARNEDNFSLQLQTVDGEFHFFEKSSLRNIEYQAKPVMPSDHAMRLSTGEINDIVSYLISVAREGWSKSGIKQTDTASRKKSSSH